jgi:two-component system LytT family response regulator
MTKVLIIDDESGAVTLLKVKLEKNFGNQFQIETALGAEEGLFKIQNHQPDLVFLDIEMPLMNGFELLSSVTNINFKIIFTTAYDQYALRAFRYNALDYLLKPINTKELVEAVNRFKTQLPPIEVYNKQIENFISRKDKNIVITTRDGVMFIELDNIIRCEAELNYTWFVLSDGDNFLSSKTLKDYEDILESNDNFIRVHRSHLVNMDYVSQCKNGSLILKDNSMIPISRRKKEEVLKKLMSTGL